jgi:hypothetical protein
MYDKFETLAMASGVTVAFLANVDMTDLEVLPVAPRGLGVEKLNELAQLWAPRGLRFIGMAGLVDGKPRTALVEPLGERHILALAQAFLTYCETLLSGHIEEQQKGDSVEWLRRLWSLPDTRPEF